MKLPNPNQGKPYERIINDAGGNPLYGIRDEHTPHEEIVDMRTNTSNHSYFQPEVMLNPEGCEHEFVISNIGMREIECRKCTLMTAFIAGVNYEEENGESYILLQGKRYKLVLR